MVVHCIAGIKRLKQRKKRELSLANEKNVNCVLVRGFWHCMVLIDQKHAFENPKNSANESDEVGQGV